jgi:ABC-2 type transport system ATP-binding protein
MSPVISLRGVSKTYDDVKALDAVSLDVEPGEIYALLGLNGAGKTTLIRLLLGMVRPTAGRVELAGRALGGGSADGSVWEHVGYLVESPSAYPELTVRENLEVVRRLRRLPDRRSVEDAIDLFGLRPYAGRRARHLSLGNLQRLGLAKALLHRPSLVVLDEPVNGLDPAGVVEIRNLLLDLAREHGMTVLLSSHLLAEVARLASRIGVLHEGRMVDELDATALASRVRTRLEVRTRDDGRAVRILEDAGLHPTRDLEGLVVPDAAAVERPDAVVTALVAAGDAPTHVAVAEDDLETYFLRLVGVLPRDAAMTEELSRDR